MRILTLLLAAFLAVTMQLTPSFTGTAQAATAKERAAAKRKAARIQRRREAARKAMRKRASARGNSARGNSARKVKRTASTRKTTKRRTVRRTTKKRKAKKTRTTRVARRTTTTRKINTRRRIVPAQYRRRAVFLRTKEKPGTIIVDTDKKYLYLVKSSRRAIRYGIGVGREGFGWGGSVKVARKAKWPSWTPPKEMIEREWKQNKRRIGFQEGGPGNPMGARALYLHKRGAGDTGYRIHGTNEPWSIGLAMSSGCVRMLNKDVEHLYDQVKVGSKVIVIGPGGPKKRGTYREGLFGLL